MNVLRSLLCVLFLIAAPAVVNADLFTVANLPDTSSYIYDARGQTFTPSVAGPEGTGSSAGDTSYLVSFQYFKGAGTYPGLMYIYDHQPTEAQLDAGTNALYTSTSQSDGVYQFDYVALDTDSKYWALFPNDIAPLRSDDRYSGGARVASVSLNEALYDVKFEATFNTNAVPEPSSVVALVGMGTVGAMFWRRRRRK